MPPMPSKTMTGLIDTKKALKVKNLKQYYTHIGYNASNSEADYSLHKCRRC